MTTPYPHRQPAAQLSRPSGEVNAKSAEHLYSIAGLTTPSTPKPVRLPPICFATWLRGGGR